MQNKKPPSMMPALVLIALMYISIVAIGLNTSNKGITGAVGGMEKVTGAVTKSGALNLDGLTSEQRNSITKHGPNGWEYSQFEDTITASSSDGTQSIAFGTSGGYNIQQIQKDSQGRTSSITTWHHNSDDELTTKTQFMYTYDPISGARTTTNEHHSGNEITSADQPPAEISNTFSLSSSCFLPTTPITLSDGTKKQIQNIQKGDKVLSYDLKNKKPVVSTVLNVFSHLENEYLIVNNKIKVTPYHYVYAKRKE